MTPPCFNSGRLERAAAGIAGRGAMRCRPFSLNIKIPLLIRNRYGAVPVAVHVPVCWPVTNGN
jgi:hypothetical protein